jgi:hypothetical protein
MYSGFIHQELDKMPYFVGFILCFMLLVWYVWLRNFVFSTADGAIIMAAGIMINGAMQQEKILREWVGPILSIVPLTLLVWLLAGYIREAIKGTFYERHLKDPVFSFATCTWVASISVTIVSIIKELPLLEPVALILFAIDLILWAAVLFIVLRNYLSFYRNVKLLNHW